MELLYKDLDDPQLATLDGYSRRGGYEMLRKALAMSREDVLAQLDQSGIRGRGGAGFAMGKKASFLPKGAMDKYLVCNADESEPGTFKDRELMQKSPHMLIEGMIIAAYVIGATRAFIYIRGEYDFQASRLEAAVEEAREAGYLGDDPRFNLRSFECLGACDIAPMASIDGAYVGPIAIDEVPTAVKQIRDGVEVLPDKQLVRRKSVDPNASGGHQ